MHWLGFMIYKGRAWKFGTNLTPTPSFPPATSTRPTRPRWPCISWRMWTRNFAKRSSPETSSWPKTTSAAAPRGSMRPWPSKPPGISCVVAKSFARIFYRNSFNMGLPIFESAEAVDGIQTGNELEVDSESGDIKNIAPGKPSRPSPFPPSCNSSSKPAG